MSSGSRKANTLLNLIIHQSDNDKVCLHVKDPYEAKYQLPINKREGLGIKDFYYSKAVIEQSNNIDDIYEYIEEYNSYRKRKLLMVFDYLIANTLSN